MLSSAQLHTTPASKKRGDFPRRTFSCFLHSCGFPTSNNPSLRPKVIVRKQVYCNRNDSQSATQKTHSKNAPVIHTLKVAAGSCILSVFVAVSCAQPSIALTEPQKLVAEAWRIVNQGYVDQSFNGHDWFKERMKFIKKPLSDSDDAYNSIREMLKMLDDPYTRFLTPAQYQSLSSSATGEIAGVGIELFPALVDDKLKVLSPVEGSPAFRSGLRPNDYLIEIDGESVDGLLPDEAAARIRGSPGTKVSLTVLRNGREIRLDMTREALRLRSVKHELRTVPSGDAVGVIRIRQFNSSTAEDVADALTDLQKRGAKKYIIDLRNNAGGYFPAGVDVARQFLEKDKAIVYVADKNGVQDEYDTLEDGRILKEPIVVLVNGNTASASEILSGALKDNKRAKLVGEKTFGKGVVQTVSVLRDGSGLAVTIARYETPSHINIHKRGIDPDIAKPCPEETDVLTCVPADF